MRLPLPPRSPALLAALAVLLVGGAVLTVSHHVHRVAVPAKAAVRDALRDPQTSGVVRRLHWNRVDASDVDGNLERVSLFEGDQIVGEFAVTRAGTTSDAVDFAVRKVPYGSGIAYEPLVLGALMALFVLMAGVAPWRRLRNLDVAAMLSLAAPVVLLQHRYVGASVLAGAPGMAYLACRAAWRALGPEGEGTQCTPLFDRLTGAWEERQRTRVLRWLLVALAAAFVMVGISSTGVDVIYAVMEGATKLIHGVLPYGHLPGDVVHGDTYPILSYALYTPLAAIAPVSSVWDSVDIALGFTVLAGLGTALVASRLTRPWPKRSAQGSGEHDTTGLRTSIMVLSFPPLMAIVSTGTTDVMLALLLSLAVLLWRRPGWSTGMLAAAGWFKLAPFALLPIWLAPLRGRRLAAGVGALVLVSAAMIAVVLGLGGTAGVSSMVHAVSYQLTRGSAQSLWATLGLTGVQPWCQAGLLAFIAGASVKLWRTPGWGEDRVRIAALSAAVMLGLQLAADYWAFLYLAWVVPLINPTLLGAGSPEQAVPEAVGRRAAGPALVGVT